VSQSTKKEVDVDNQWLAGERLVCLANGIEDIAGTALPDGELELIEACRCGQVAIPAEWRKHFALLLGGNFIVTISFTPCDCSSKRDRARQSKEASKTAEHLARLLCSDEDQECCHQRFLDFILKHKATLVV